MDDNQRRQGGGNRNRRRSHNRPNPASNYTPPYAADILAKPLSDIGLAPETVTVLNAGRLSTLGDVARRRKQEMFRVQNFGKKQLAELMRCMAAAGVDFRPDEAPADAQKPAEAASAKQDNNGKKGDKERKGQQPQQRDQRQGQPDANRPKPAQQGGDNRQNKGKDKKGRNAQYDESLTLDKLFPKPKITRLPRIEQEMDEFVKFQRGGKWGFKNRQGQEVIPPIYDEVFNFKDDYACVERKQLFGYINRQNELVIPYRFVCASSFSEGYACVSDEEKCGYINKQGEVVVPFKYEAGTPVKDGLAHVKLDGKWGTLNVLTNTLSWA